MNENADAIEIICAKCKKHFQQPIAGLKDERSAICPNCGFHVFSDPVTYRRFFQDIVKRDEQSGRV